MTLYMKFVSLRPKFIISFMIGVDLFSGAGGLSNIKREKEKNADCNQ